MLELPAFDTFFFVPPAKMRGRVAELEPLSGRRAKSPSAPMVVGVVLADTSCSPKHKTCIDGVCGDPIIDVKLAPMAPISSEHMSVRRTCFVEPGGAHDGPEPDGDMKDFEVAKLVSHAGLCAIPIRLLEDCSALWMAAGDAGSMFRFCNPQSCQSPCLARSAATKQFVARCACMPLECVCALAS